MTGVFDLWQDDENLSLEMQEKRNTVVIVCLWNIWFSCLLLKVGAIMLSVVKKKNGETLHSEPTSQGSSDVYEINRLFHLF